VAGDVVERIDLAERSHLHGCRHHKRGLIQLPPHTDARLVPGLGITAMLAAKLLKEIAAKMWPSTAASPGGS